MTPYRIVEATAADVTTIERIARLTWPDTFGDILPPEQIDYMLHMMYRPEVLRAQLAAGHTFLLLLTREDAGRAPDYAGGSGDRYAAVGYVGFEQDYLPGTTKVHKIYLLPAVQGRGYGRVLLDEVAQRVARAGQQRLRLDVNYQNQAIGFYEHYGFRKLDRYDTDIGNGYLMEDWRMEKIL